MTKPNATAPETCMNRVGDFPSILARPHIFWMVSYITNALWKSASITPTTAGAIDHVFGLCHLLGFRFAPRIRDLADLRLFVADGRVVYTALNPMIGGTLDFRGISFLVWEIHKPIAGVVGSNVGALQPGKVDNQCVEKIPLFVFRGMERRPPTVGRYPGAYLRSLD